MNAETVTVELSDRSYPIRIGSGILNDPEFLAAQVKGRRCFLVTDSNVYPLFAEKTVEAVLNAGAAEIVVHLPCRRGIQASRNDS